ncbi:sterol desaturase family protein [Paucibacter sp. APW11]|uniref:Sterol desaturase family protein n=1 Tax=Roseateles aquae TaxID=3077235 RepID=A0ABU3P970_9BURK|nr:sterol desaturase family protein [Paucibacter sp. APW11]MDT8998276.1 sterol desaturase family protein [Paucibacter sp. APW11]
MLEPIVYAVPVFLLMMVLEWWLGRRRGLQLYRAADTVGSLANGIASQLVALFVKAWTVGIYAWVWQHGALIKLPANAVWVWLLALVGYDFCYYWLHRCGHTMAILWAAHEVHHSSEEYNLSTALRQSSSGFLFGWLFYLPLALLGVPPLVFIGVGLIDLLYQFWVHTRLVGRLGWFDRWFCSPSNHRVHHGQNDYCLDRNYGGILMCWDHLFGSFVDEKPDEPIIYGTLTPLHSWSPLRANTRGYAQIWADARLAERRSERVSIWFRHPGWRPESASRLAPKPAPDLRRFQRYEPALPAGMPRHGLEQLFVLLLAGVLQLALAPRLSEPLNLLASGLIVWQLVLLSRTLDDGSLRREGARLLLQAGLAAALLALSLTGALSPGLPDWAQPALATWAALGLAASALGGWRLARSR